MGTTRKQAFEDFIDSFDCLAFIPEGKKLTPEQREMAQKRLTDFIDLKSKYKKRLAEATKASVKHGAMTSLTALSDSIARLEKQLAA